MMRDLETSPVLTAEVPAKSGKKGATGDREHLTHLKTCLAPVLPVQRDR